MKLQTIEWLQSKPDLCGVTREQCARDLGVHPQTLQAKLEKEDVDFRFLLIMERTSRVRLAGSTEEAVMRTGLSRDSVYRIRSGMNP